MVYVLAVWMYRARHVAAWLARCYLRFTVPILSGIVLVLCILSMWQNRQRPNEKRRMRRNADASRKKADV